ncbi:OmpA family protein [uncultured Bacteroides sp.]|uniref:OmpA family protein n=1 Tax=uncultured Bacteroides sp. TaxID=162156 RepID=UPI002AA912A3|nr:OmpA family protein [uncultured Bacteroides sp.]
MRKSRYRLLTLFMLFSVTVMKSYATDEVQDSLRKSYDWSEKWYYQVQGGVNHLLAENIRFVSFGKTLSPSYTFAVGKRFTPLWGSRIQFLYGKDKGVYYDHDKDSPMFSFRHYGIIAEGTFNFANFVRGNNIVGREKKWNLDLKFGIGFIHSASYELADVQNYNLLNPVPRDNFTFYAGAEVSKVVCKNVDVNFELSANRLGNRYNGQICGNQNTEVIGDILTTALIGIRYTIPCKKPCKSTFVYVNAPLPAIPIKGNVPTKKEAEVVKEVETAVPPPCYNIDELLLMVKQGKSIRGKRLCGIEMVHFNFDKSDIKPEFALYLDKLATLMLNCPDIRLLIMGHTDIKGSVDYNYGLSERRSKGVMEYLKRKGVNYNRMIYSYYSKLNPRTENVTDFGRSVNRRVEFMILP